MRHTLSSPGPRRLAFVLTSALSSGIAGAGLFDQHQGKATFYGYGGGGHCSLPAPDMLTAAMNHTDSSSAGECCR